MDFQSVCTTDTNTIFAALSWWRWHKFSMNNYFNQGEKLTGNLQILHILDSKICSQIQIHAVCVPCAIEENRRSRILFLKIEKVGTEEWLNPSSLLHCTADTFSFAVEVIEHRETENPMKVQTVTQGAQQGKYLLPTGQEQGFPNQDGSWVLNWKWS